MKRQLDYVVVRNPYGGYLKLAGICTAVVTAIGVGCCAVFMKPAWWKATKNFVKRLFKR